MPENEQQSGYPEEGTSPVALAAAWALVGIPLAWGLIATLAKAALLFR